MPAAESPAPGAGVDVSVVNGIDLSEQDLKFGRSEIKSEAGFDYGLQRIIEGKAKADGSNPELVKAVEELLTPKENAIQEQEASSVPIQPKAEGSQEVQGTQPESGPKEVADKGEKEALIPKEFKPSVESKKAAKAFVELSNSE